MSGFGGGMLLRRVFGSLRIVWLLGVCVRILFVLLREVVCWVFGFDFVFLYGMFA